MTDPSSYVARRTQDYARALCDARAAMRHANTIYADTLREAPEALPYLDGVKRVMEIDTEVADPTVILLRLSVDVPA